MQLAVSRLLPPALGMDTHQHMCCHFLLQMSLTAQAEQEASAAAAAAASHNTSNMQQQQQQQDGAKGGQRDSRLVHAWVLVLPGKREVSWLAKPAVMANAWVPYDVCMRSAPDLTARDKWRCDGRAQICLIVSDLRQTV